MTRQLISDQLIKNTAIAATEYFPGLRRKVKESEIVLDDPIIVSNNWRSKAACFAVKDFIELSQKEPYLDALPAGTQSMQEKYCMACPVARVFV